MGVEEDDNRVGDEVEMFLGGNFGERCLDEDDDDTSIFNEFLGGNFGERCLDEDDDDTSIFNEFLGGNFGERFLDEDEDVGNDGDTRGGRLGGDGAFRLIF